MSQQPDVATAKDTGGGFDPHPEGQYAMVCVDVVNLGTRIEQFGDGDPRETAKVALVFASGERKNDQLYLVTVEMTNSMNEKANLRKFLESWRGKSYTPKQAEAGVPLQALHGHTALVSVEHITTKRGRQFARVRAIAPLPKAMPAPNGDVLETYSRPSFFDERKKEYAKQLAEHRARSDDPGPTASEEPYLDPDDDLPF